MKLSSKGFNNTELNWTGIGAKLCWKVGGVDTATNRGLRMNGGVMCTYEQDKLGLSAYYEKH